MTAETRNLSLKILKFGYNTGFTPVYWDGGTKGLKVSNSKIRLGWTKIQLLLILLYELFLLWQALKPCSEGGTSRIRERYLAGLWIFMNCDQIGNIFISEYVELMNKLNDYIGRNDSKCKPMRNVLKFPFLFVNIPYMDCSETFKDGRDRVTNVHQSLGLHRCIHHSDGHNHRPCWLLVPDVADVTRSNAGRASLVPLETSHSHFPLHHKWIPLVRLLAAMDLHCAILP